jgi:hypothetical protein
MGCLQLDYYEDKPVRAHERTRSHEPKMVLCWLSTDPLAERGPEYSPYSFCFDNPMRFKDPDGRWPDPAWLKSYVVGAWKATANLAVGVATSTYNSGRNAVHATQSVASAYHTGGVTGAVKEYANQVYQTSGAKSAVQTLQKASTGDAKALATTVVNVAAVVLTHQIVKGSSPSVETPSTTNLYRAVSNAELTDISKNGLSTTAGGYETAKLFTTTAENASQFGKNNFAFDGIPNTIIEAKVPQSVMNTTTPFTADGMPAVAVPAEQLQNIKTVTPSTSSPIVN